MFIMYYGIGSFNWDVFCWSFFLNVKTKTLNVLVFASVVKGQKWLDRFMNIKQKILDFPFFNVTLIIRFTKVYNL